MDISNFRNICKEINEQVGYDLINNVITNMDVNSHIIKSDAHSEFTTIGNLKQTLNRCIHHSNDKDYIRDCKDIRQNLCKASEKCSSSDVILVEPLRNNYIQFIIIAQDRLIQLIAKYGFITAHQIKTHIAKAINSISSRTVTDIKKKINLSRFYLALKVAVPDDTKLSTSLPFMSYVLNLIQSVSSKRSNFNEIIPHIQQDHKNTDKCLNSIKSIIHNQIASLNATKMSLTKELANNKRYMHMSRKQLLHAMNIKN